MADHIKKKPVANGVKVVKKPLGERFAETFFGGTVKDAKAYTMHEIIVPAIKNMVYESFTGALDRLLNGANSGYRYRNYGPSTRVGGGVSVLTAQTSYSSAFKPGPGSNAQLPAINGYASSRNPDMLIFPSKGAADAVLDALRRQIIEYGATTVSDYYDFADVSATKGSFTDSYYGWTNLDGARTRMEQGGYTIILPPTEQVK